MKLFSIKNLLFAFCFLTNSQTLLAQEGFKMVDLYTEKTREFRFGNMVMFQLKETANDSLLSTGIVNKETRVYELMLTGMKGQDLIFNNKFVVPYSNIKWLFIQTSGRVIKQIFGLLLFGGLVPLYAYDQFGGVVVSVFIMPFSVVLLHSAERNYFTNSHWAIQSLELYGDRK